MKNGFTIVELLSVILILSILIIIAIPTIAESANKVKVKNLETAKNMLENALLKYVGDHYIDEVKPDGDICESDNCCIYFSMDYIREYNVFQANDGILNPVTGKALEGYIKVSYDLNKFDLVAKYEGPAKVDLKRIGSIDKSCTINCDLDGDKWPDVNVDTNGDSIADKYVVNLNNFSNSNLLVREGKPNINIDLDGDNKADINIDLDGNNTPDINIDTDGDNIPDKDFGYCLSIDVSEG